MSLPQETASHGVRWDLSIEEREQLGKFLDVEASTFDHITGNHMNRARIACKGCGKHSGLDDMVHNAMALGIHSKSFMVNTLVNGPSDSSPAHTMTCSRCSEQFEGMFYWVFGISWTG